MPTQDTATPAAPDMSGVNAWADYLRLQLDIAAHVSEATSALELDAVNPYCGDWFYHEPWSLRDAPAGERRAAALAWLARHNKGMQQIARRFDSKVEKFATSTVFGLQVTVERDGQSHCIQARVDASLTCEMVDTGEVEVIPAQPEQIRPVFEKRCPESIFAGIQDEIEVAA